MKILGLQGSPRKGGNTDILLDAFLKRAGKAGAQVQTIQVSRAGIVPCKGCGYCETHGTCVIADDPMSKEIFGLLRTADLVVAASPVYFYGVTAQLKVLIDRCQTLWSRKHIFKLKDPLAATRQGLLISVAASRGRQLFDGVQLTAKYFFDAIDARFSHTLVYRGVEKKGEIRKQPDLSADMEAAVEKTVLPQLARKRILFVSTQGACRAPMAAALAQTRVGDTIRCDWGGSRPATALSDPMVQALHRAGVDLGYRHPQHLEQAFGGAPPDLVVTIGEAISQQPWKGAEGLHWPISAPAVGDDDAIERLRLALVTHADDLKQWIKRS